MKKIFVITLCMIGIAWKEQFFVEEQGHAVLKEIQYPDPTNHFDWMPALKDDDVANQPEWNHIHFGHNPVPWITFRRGIYGGWWNPWNPGTVNDPNAVIFQSTFEPVAIKTNGTWVITFKKP